MKRAILLIFFLISLKVSAQQTFWTPGVPPGSTSFSPTFRFSGTDSLSNIYLSNGSKWWLGYTAAQSNLRFLRKADSILNIGYVTHYYFNHNKGNASKVYADSLNAAIFSQGHTYAVQQTFNAGININGTNLDMQGGVILNTGQIYIKDSNGATYQITKFPGTMQLGTSKYGFTVDSGTNKIYSAGSGGIGPGIPVVYAAGTSSQYIKGDGTYGTYAGGGSGTVTNVSSANTDINVATGSTTPVLTLNNVNGVTKTYYDPTSSIQTQLNGKQASLGFTPENVANKKTTLTNSTTDYPSTSAVKTVTDANTTAIGNRQLKLITALPTPTGNRPVVGDSIVMAIEKNVKRQDSLAAAIGANTTNIGLRAIKDSTYNINKNLYDVLSKSTARTNLDVYSTTQVNAAIATVAGSIPVGGNPTATAGINAVNGTSLAWMRADAAPKIDTSSTGFKTNAAATTDRNNLMTRITANTSNITANYTAIGLKQPRILPSFTPSSAGAIASGDSVQRALEKAQYQINTNTSNIATNTSSIALKLNITDTTSMLGNVVHIAKSETITGPKTFNQPVIMKNQSGTPATPPAGYTAEYFDNLSRKSYINSSGFTRTYRIQYPGNVLAQFPYKASSILADSTDIAAAYALQATTISPGYGMTGGGSLASNRTLSADSTLLQTVLNLFPKTDTRYYTKTAGDARYLTASSTNTVTNKDLTSGTNTFPTFNQNTTGSAAKWTNARTINLSGVSATGQSIDGSGNVTIPVTAVPSSLITGILPIANGGTGSATQNFVDLTTNQSGIGGIKGWSPVTTAATVAVPYNISHTASANSQQQIGVQINATYTDGAFTGVIHKPFSIAFGTSNFAISDMTAAGDIDFHASATPTTSNYFFRTDGSATYLNAPGSSSSIFIRNNNTTSATFFNSGGRILLQTGGTQTDNGTDKLQVNGSIISGVAGTSTGAVKLAGATSGTIAILPQAAAGSYNFNLPNAVGTAGQVLTSQAGGSTAMTWSNVPLNQASANLTGQTAAGNITTFTVGAATATFNVSAYVNVTAVSTDVIQAQITYTDENNTSQTVSFTTLNSVTNSTYSPITIRAKNATVITLKTNLTVGAGSITFDAGGSIIQN